MTFTAVAQTNSKTAEFACLFDLFDRIATRRTRAIVGDASEVISADDIADVPKEFVPVLRNLSTILSLRARRDQEHAPQHVQAASSTKPRHSTVVRVPSMTFTVEDRIKGADPMEPSDDVKEDTENLTFPLGERYPFTFRLMLHKLYDLDEWAEKVKDAVETSKSQFKPLTEQVHNAVRGVTASVKERERQNNTHPVLGASAKFKPPSTLRQAHAVSRDASTSNKERGEKRSGVQPVLGPSARFSPPSTTRRAHPAGVSSKPNASRVVKKRCIGRRKSLSGPISTGIWVYDAAISATEVASSCPAVEITLSMSMGMGSAVEHRVRHRSLTTLEEMRMRDTARRKIKIAVPLLREEVTASSVLPPQSLSVRQEAIQTESVGRRSVASVFASESCKRVAVKRPLCV